MSENCKKHIKPVSGLNCPAAVLVVNIEKIERKGKYYLSFFSPFIGVFGFFMGFFDIFYLYFNVLAFFADLLHLRHKIQQFLWLFCNSVFLGAVSGCLKGFILINACGGVGGLKTYPTAFLFLFSGSLKIITAIQYKVE